MMNSIFGVGRRKKFVVTEPDPVYEVVYLGNVVTGMAAAKGDGCADRALALLWRTYCARRQRRQQQGPAGAPAHADVHMTLTVTRSGLTGLTKHQGLTEYWAHRITHCQAAAAQAPGNAGDQQLSAGSSSASASASYPSRIFCWIYKHEGKKMKPELRCHAVLCKRADQPKAIAQLLHEKISCALRDYKRDKIARQNERLRWCSAAAGGGSGAPAPPMRRIMLSVGGQNFRPPVSRSRSAPRLHMIEEGDDQDDQDPELVDLCMDELANLRVVDIITTNDNSSSKINHFHQSSDGDDISDESGYQEEKCSVEDEDLAQEEEDDDPRDCFITAL